MGGIFHEQSRPDRDDFVKINWDNVSGGKDNNNFAKKTNTDVLGNTYDYGSVMHYTKTAFSSNGKETITPIQQTNGADIGQRQEADDMDILDIRLLYQCVSGPRTLSEYNANKCTSDCKCWKNEEGCKGNDNFCQGNLICSNNRCIKQDDGEGDGGVGETTKETSSPTISPTSSNGENGKCMDSPEDWHDSDGAQFTCEWYEEGNRCAKYGNMYENFGKTANQACCACGGGLSRSNDAMFPEGHNDNTIKIGGKCIGLDEMNVAMVRKCDQGDDQKWRYDKNTKQLKNKLKELCLSWDETSNIALADSCSGKMNQKWYIDSTVRGKLEMIRVSNEKAGRCIAYDTNNFVILQRDCFFGPKQKVHFG